MDPFREYNDILSKYLYKETLCLLEAAWKEPHRYYHTVEHLVSVINEINKSRFYLNRTLWEGLILAAFFHDVYYNPRDNKNNEDESIKRFLSSYNYQDLNLRAFVIKTIESTKWRKRPIDPIIKLFWEANNSGFLKGYEHLLENEKKIRREFSHLPNNIYKKRRVKFLKTNLGLFSKEIDNNINKLIDYIEKEYI